MYVPKKAYARIIDLSLTKTVTIIARSEYFPGNLHIKFEVNRYPCGRIKLVALFAGSQVTGDVKNTLKHITFDSVKSLYNVPGLRVLTDPSVVYLACGVRVYGVK